MDMERSKPEISELSDRSQEVLTTSRAKPNIASYSTLLKAANRLKTFDTPDASGKNIRLYPRIKIVFEVLKNSIVNREILCRIGGPKRWRGLSISLRIVVFEMFLDRKKRLN